MARARWAAVVSQGQRWARPGGVVRASGWLLVAAAFSRAVSVGALVVVARLLTPTEMGRFSLLQSASLLVAGAAGLGLGLALSRQVAHVRGTSLPAVGRLLGTGMLVTAASGVTIAVACGLGRGWLAADVAGDARLEPLVLPAAAAMAAMALVTSAQAGLAGLEAFGEVGRLQAAQAVLSSVGALIGASGGRALPALTGFAVGQALSAAVGCALLARQARRMAIPVAARLERAEARSLARVAWPALVAMVVLSAALLGSQVLLSNRPGGYREMAEFSVAYRWHLAILFVPSAAVPVLVPVLTRLRRDADGDERRALRLSLLAGLGVAAVPAVVVAVAAPLILSLSGAFYGDRPLTLVILAVAAVPCVANNVLSSAAVGFGAMRAWLWSDVALAIGVVGTAVLLIPSMGAGGLALGYLAGYLLTDGVLAPAVLRRPAPGAG